MKLVFASIFVVLLGLSLLAWSFQPRAVEHGRTVLTWVSDDNPVRKDQVHLFNKLHSNLTLRLDPNNGGMEKVIVQSVAGVGPDLFDCYDGFQLSGYVKSGIAWDVTSQLKKAGIDEPRDVWPAALPLVMLDGRVYGFPTNVCTNGLWYNRELFDRAHVDYPTGSLTWEQFLPIARKLTIRDSEGRARQFGLLIDWANNWQQFMIQWGGRLYSPDGTRCIVDSPDSVAGIQFMHDLVYKEHVSPTPIEEAAMATQGGWGSGTITQFEQGASATAIGGRWWLCTLRGKGMKLGALECPHGPYRVFLGYGRATLINKNSPRRQQALEFLKYMDGRPYNKLVNDDADALSAVIKWSYAPDYLLNPKYPDEDFNEVWRQEMKLAIPQQVSPFVNGQAAQRILTNQIDLIKSDQKPVDEALHDAARQINEEIQKTLKLEPDLRARYTALTGGARP